MNQDQPGLTLEESIKQSIQALPPVIRNFLEEGKSTMTARALMTKYGLRVDQGGVLEREIILLLMGVENPDEFTQSLAQDAQMSTDTINSIVRDVNDQIFVPLRDEMRRASVAPPAGVPQVSKPQASVVSVQSAQSPPPPVPPINVLGAQPPAAPTIGQLPKEFHFPKANAPYVPDMPKGVYAPPLQSPRYPNQENISSYVRTVAYQRPQSINRIQPQRTGQPINPLRPAMPVATPAARPVAAAPTPAVAAPRPPEAVKRLEDHEEPHIELSKPPTPPAATPPVARTAPPPPNLPGTSPLRQVIPPVAAAPAQRPPAPVAPSAPPPRPYSTDPYREPVDENS